MKTVDFSEFISASDLKGRRSRHLIEFAKVCEGQLHFFTIYFPGFICFVLYWAKVGARLQDHWSSDLLAHLSRRLIGDLIVNLGPCSGVRTSYVVHNFKHLLLQNRLPDQSQILCGPPLGRRDESLFADSGSHDQDGRHVHIW